MWAEQTDDANFESVVWPRTAAVAERLWTSPGRMGDTQDPGPGGQLELSSEVLRRLASFRCLLHRRGIDAGPVAWPSYCPTVDYPTMLDASEIFSGSENGDNHGGAVDNKDIESTDSASLVIASALGAVGGGVLVAVGFILHNKKSGAKAPTPSEEHLLPAGGLFVAV